MRPESSFPNSSGGGVAPAVKAPVKKGRFALWDWLETILVALVLALILRTFVIQPYEVHLSSMHPTLEEGDFILVNKLAFKFGKPSRGDVVVFLPPVQTEKDYVKRVIGLPGETVDIKDGKVFINGVALEEPYALGTTSGGKYNHIQVPENTVFVMGDNRMNSSDSRTFGPVSIASLEGKTILLFWPISRLKWVF